MEDGTRDKNNRENIALAIRYVKDGVVNESLLMVKTTENLDAATFTELTLNTLTENNIDPLVCLANAMMAQNIDENDEPFKSEYFETLDILIAELQRRFSDNDDLINSIASLDELDVDKMVPLKNLGLKIPSREEASVVKAYLSRNEDIMENTLQVLYRQREAFKDTYELLQERRRRRKNLGFDESVYGEPGDEELERSSEPESTRSEDSVYGYLLRIDEVHQRKQWLSGRRVAPKLECEKARPCDDLRRRHHTGDNNRGGAHERVGRARRATVHPRAAASSCGLRLPEKRPRKRSADLHHLEMMLFMNNVEYSSVYAVNYCDAPAPRP
ncbi:hypothetical protein EVAR_90324_1 [Eumeta japonica]|uniref:Uncharacterized protein n=1 Tax=Eumeta variegata TaxID=151549 RepID=A0A4C1YLE4_EUMVA|nr:hypothetical protein EVAR_90324_1 [Eumeta japonica]